jgi:membrane-associated phospholipid phosphatase
MPTMDHGLPEPVAVKLGPLGRYELRAALLVIAMALVGIPFGLLLHQVTTDGPLTALDDSAARWLNARFHGEDGVITLLHIVSFLGKPIFLLFAIGIPGLWIFMHGGRKLGIFLAVTCIGGGIVDTIVKVSVGRPRPEVDEPIVEAFGKSFPSGHSMQAVVCYGALLLVLLPLLNGRNRTLAIGAYVALFLAIGFSRLSLGVHFISDVLGGYVLGAAWLAGSVAVFEIWREERGKRHTHVTVEGVEPEEAKKLPVPA